MALTQEQKDFYCENGYLAYEQVLTSEELDLLRVEYDSEFQKAQETNAFRNLALEDGGDAEAKRAAPVQMYQIMNRVVVQFWAWCPLLFLRTFGYATAPTE